MTIAEEIIHELKRLRIKADKDVIYARHGSLANHAETHGFRAGIYMSILMANQINNRRSRKK